jgi:cation transport regulator ChaC
MLAITISGPDRRGMTAAFTDDNAPIGIPEGEAEQVREYLRTRPRARTLYDQLKLTNIHVDGHLLKELGRIITHLERRAREQMRSNPVSSADDAAAAKYLKLLFPPGSSLYRVVYLKRLKAVRKITAGVVERGDDEPEAPSDD